MSLGYDIFEGPTKYSIYGGPPGATPKRVSGYNTLAEIETYIFNHKKSFPNWEYSVWKSLGWEEVKL